MASVNCPTPYPRNIGTERKTTAGGTPIQAASKRHLTVDDICEDLEITRSTFYDWRLKRKAPPCFKLPNGEIRVRRADYEAWIASRMDSEVRR